MPKKKKSSIASKIKLPKGKNNSLLMVVGIIVLAFILILIFRGWVRKSVIPDALTPFYSSSLQSSFNKTDQSLNNPFGTLGFTTINANKTKCDLEEAQSIHTEIGCFVGDQAYTVLPTSPTAIANEQSQATKLQNLLEADGWQSGGNGVTLTSLIDGTSKGVDSSPDAAYEKVFGNLDCTIDTSIAYASPQPAAINSTLYCTRTINVLGAPAHEFYNSSRAL